MKKKAMAVLAVMLATAINAPVASYAESGIGRTPEVCSECGSIVLDYIERYTFYEDKAEIVPCELCAHKNDPSYRAMRENVEIVPSERHVESRDFTTYICMNCYNAQEK